MTPSLKYALSLIAAGLAAVLLAGACSNDESKAAVKNFKDSFTDFIEGRDDYALLRYVPDNYGELEITVDSGRTRYAPESLEDLEFLFEEVAYELSGDSATVLQSNETYAGDGLSITYTIKVVDGYLERTVPVKVRLRKSEDGDAWVLVSLDVFN